jgi:hypothetical protein
MPDQPRYFCQVHHQGLVKGPLTLRSSLYRACQFEDSPRQVDWMRHAKIATHPLRRVQSFVRAQFLPFSDSGRPNYNLFPRFGI